MNNLRYTEWLQYIVKMLPAVKDLLQESIRVNSCQRYSLQLTSALSWRGFRNTFWHRYQSWSDNQDSKSNLKIHLLWDTSFYLNNLDQDKCSQRSLSFFLDWFTKNKDCCVEHVFWIYPVEKRGSSLSTLEWNSDTHACSFFVCRVCCGYRKRGIDSLPRVGAPVLSFCFVYVPFYWPCAYDFVLFVREFPLLAIYLCFPRLKWFWVQELGRHLW